jgi:hypothetical protein
MTGYTGCFVILFKRSLKDQVAKSKFESKPPNGWQDSKYEHTASSQFHQNRVKTTAYIDNISINVFALHEEQLNCFVFRTHKRHMC